jgi:glycosyltransferase involved in cell wall biosynthesis
MGIDVRVVVLEKHLRNPLVTELDPRVDIVMTSGEPRRLVRELRAFTAGRLVHIHFGDGYIHPLVRAALVDRTVIVTYHSVYRHKRTWLKNRVDQLCASRAAAIIAVSDAVRDFCVDDVQIPAERITVIPNAIAFESGGQPARTRRAGELVAVSLASMYAHKNQALLLEALSIARREGHNVRLRLIGDGPALASVHRMCLDLGLSEAVEWHGAVWRREIVQSLLADADVFVSASRAEGLPLSILEAIAHGLPLLLSDIGPHREAAGDAGLYFTSDDARDLARKLETLAQNPKLGLELSRKSKSRAGSFDVAACIADNLELYRRVHSAGQAARGARS